MGLIFAKSDSVASSNIKSLNIQTWEINILSYLILIEPEMNESWMFVSKNENIQPAGLFLWQVRGSGPDIEIDIFIDHWNGAQEEILNA